LKPEYVVELGVQFSATWWLTGSVLLPESATVNGEFVALLTMVTLPGRLPAEAGANVTLKEAD